MNKKANARDIGIELARVFGCLIVIGVHLSLGDVVGGAYDSSRGLINCFLADGVAVFWLITGCFLFHSVSYKKVLLRTANSVLLPMAIYSVFCVFFSQHIQNGGQIFRSVYTTYAEYLQGLKDIFWLKQTIPNTFHLWYCYAYALVMLVFPVLKAFVQWMEQEKKREIWFCVISFSLLVFNDFTGNQALAFSHHGLNAAIPSAIVIIWGNVLYRNKERLFNKKFLWLIASVCFILLNILRMFIILKTNSRSVLYWFTSFGLMCGIFVFILSYTIGNWLKNKKVISSLIAWLARYTFFIYLVHILVIGLLKRYRIPTMFFERLSFYTEGFVLECLYTVSLVFIVFLLSLFVSVIISSVVFALKHISKTFIEKLK